MQSEDIIAFFETSSKVILESGKKNEAVIARIVQKMISCFDNGNKLLIFGNGGSASQSQHFAAEIVNKFKVYRKALPAVALTTDSSVLTSISNDLEYDAVFSRQVEALGRPGDMAWGLSTSGTSANVLRAFAAAKKAGMFTVAFAGSAGSELEAVSDICLTAQSQETPNIQEFHLCAGHIICDLIEKHYLHSAE